MKRMRVFIAAIGVIAVIGGAVAVLDDLSYRDRVPFLTPLVTNEPLKIRHDSRGSGAFLAKRKGQRRHTGIDLAAASGTPVRAVKGGRASVTYDRRGFGHVVEIRHRDHSVTLYGHLREALVKDRARVRQGQIIGTVGKTGNARYRGIAPHLHFEVRKDGKPQDPLNGFLTATDFSPDEVRHD